MHANPKTIARMMLSKWGKCKNRSKNMDPATSPNPSSATSSSISSTHLVTSDDQLLYTQGLNFFFIRGWGHMKRGWESTLCVREERECCEAVSLF
jgi:hypothetical protein